MESLIPNCTSEMFSDDLGICHPRWRSASGGRMLRICIWYCKTDFQFTFEQYREHIRSMRLQILPNDLLNYLKIALILDHNFWFDFHEIVTNHHLYTWYYFLTATPRCWESSSLSGNDRSVSQSASPLERWRVVACTRDAREKPCVLHAIQRHVTLRYVLSRIGWENCTVVFHAFPAGGGDCEFVVMVSVLLLLMLLLFKKYQHRRRVAVATRVRDTYKLLRIARIYKQLEFYAYSGGALGGEGGCGAKTKTYRQ